MAHPAARILNIAVPARDHVDVGMLDGLPGGETTSRCPSVTGKPSRNATARLSAKATEDPSDMGSQNGQATTTGSIP
jgi:hypothetical protein